MIGFLRLAGLLNAAIWFGAAIFFTLGAGPAVFSQDMKDALRQNNPYFYGAIAQVLISRYFRLQLICGVIALLHLVMESLYLGKSSQRMQGRLVIALFVTVMVGGFWLQPRLKTLNLIRYSPASRPEVAVAAAQTFRTWHGVAQAINLAMVGGLAVYLWSVANSSEPTRFVSGAKFRS